MVVPRDRIELSTPGFSAARTDVRRCPQKSTIVFTHGLKSRVASGVAHQHPGTKVSAKVSFAMGPQPPERPVKTPVIECATALVTLAAGIGGTEARIGAPTLVATFELRAFSLAGLSNPHCGATAR
jgi:hypothetical protein